MRSENRLYLQVYRYCRYSDLMVSWQFCFWKPNNPVSVALHTLSLSVGFTVFALLTWLFALATRASLRMSPHHGVLAHNLLLYGYCFSGLRTS